jgi:DNA-binding MarR family transcriptional regulator
MSSQASRAWIAIARAHAAVAEAIDRDVRRGTDLNLSSLEVLLELERAGGVLSMTDLAAGVRLSRTRVSRVVEELDLIDLARREKDALGDQRITRVRITAIGRERAKAAAPIYEKALSRALKPLTSASLQQVAESLEQITASRAGPTSSGPSLPDAPKVEAGLWPPQQRRDRHDRRYRP